MKMGCESVRIIYGQALSVRSLRYGIQRVVPHEEMVPAAVTIIPLWKAFFHSLKVEHIFFEKYATRAEAKTSIFDYIETLYNWEMRHSHLNYEAPLLFEQNYVNAA